MDPSLCPHTYQSLQLSVPTTISPYDYQSLRLSVPMTISPKIHSHGRLIHYDKGQGTHVDQTFGSFKPKSASTQTENIQKWKKAKKVYTTHKAIRRIQRAVNSGVNSGVKVVSPCGIIAVNTRRLLIGGCRTRRNRRESVMAACFGGV